MAQGIQYVIRDDVDKNLNAHFVVYDTGAVRHLGGDEAGWLLNSRTGYVPPKLIAERDKSALTDLFRDSATYLRPAWWNDAPGAAVRDAAPYKPRA